jgi:hypothetical protein
MRLILKLIAATFALVLTIVTALFAFVLSASDVIFGLVSSLVFIASVILFCMGETAGGAAFLAIAFLVSPVGLPKLGEWLVGRLDSLSGALKGFIFG